MSAPAHSLAAFPLEISAAPTEPVATICAIPDALQQLIQRIEERRNAHLRASESLRNLKNEIEKRWQIASSEGHTSSAMLAQVLETGWKQWKEITELHNT